MTVDSPEVHRGRPEAARTWARRAPARSSAPSTTRTPSRCSPAARPPFLVSGPWAIADIEKAGIPVRHLRHPGFADGKPASPFIGVNGFYLASKGKNKALAQEFLTSFVPTADFQSGLYEADPRRPALTESADAVKAADDPEHPEVRGRRRQDGTILPAIPAMGQVWSPFGIAEAAIVGGDDPETALKAAAKAIRDGIANQ